MGRFFTQRFLIVILVAGSLSTYSYGQSIFSNTITGTDPGTISPYTTGQISIPNVTVSGISRGSGITGNVGNDRYNARGWDSPLLDLDDYFEFTLTPSSGYQLDFLNFMYSGTSSSPDGPTAFAFRSSIDGFTVDIPTANATGSTIDLSGASYQGITPAITFRFYAWGAATRTGTFSIDNFTFNGAAPPISKFYRSITSGNWASPAIWESSLDSATWNPASFPPAASDKHITVQATHTVVISSSTSLDETTINGTLQVLGSGALNIRNGVNDDIFIGNNGVLQVISAAGYTSTILTASSASINVATGGKIEIGDGTVAVGTGYEGFATGSLAFWNDVSTFEWNTTTPFIFGGGVTYFPTGSSSGIPNFLITQSAGTSSGTDATVNGLFVVNTDLAVTTTGTKIFRDGISGNAQLTLGAGSGGTYTITASTAIIGGTVTINLNKDLQLAMGVTIPLGASVNIIGVSLNTISKPNGIFLVDGTVDMHSTNMSNTGGSVSVNGTLKTSSPKGLHGTGQATVTSGTITFGINSTIEYNANGDQDVQGSSVPNYYNVTFSGSGIKTLVSKNDVVGTVTIAGSAIFDSNYKTFGSAATNLTMTSTSRYIASGSGTKPDAGGTYILGDNTTMEFAGTSGLTIRLGGSASLFYSNIIVNGTNVSQASNGAGIKFKPGAMGTFTVKNGATFKLHNTAGFTGGITTAINNANNPTVTVEDGSTINYSNAGDQTITTQVGLPYYNLAFSGSGNKIAPAGVLTVNGNLSKSGTSNFLHNGGTVLLNGMGPQNFAGLTYNNLILSNGTKITSGTSTIIDSIKVNSGATLSISSSDTITLHSDANRTARLGQLNGTAAINYNGTGKFLVERFISQKRAWRFLSVAVNSTQSIKQQWQEGAAAINVNPKPGYGTQITDNNSATWLANGFDTYSAGGPSMKYYDPTTNSYIGISSTLTPLDPTLGGYMTFIRGDRSATAFGSPVTSTTLRSSGQLYTGDQGSFTAPTNQFAAVNNPYASPIDLRKIFMSPTVFYYIWDPNRLGIPYGLGAFQTLVWNGSGYNVIPGTGSYGATNNFIESGQAFFTGTLGPPFTMQLTENAKADATFMIAPFTPVGSSDPGIRTNLYTVNTDGSTLLADGTLINFSDDYDNAIDGMDAHKLTNFGENVAIQSNNQSLVVERKKTVHTNDTLFYKIWGLRALPYRFELIADQMDKAGVDAYFEDNYLHTRTLLDLNGTTTIDFTVDNNIGSTASNRFQVVFEAAAGPLPVTLTSVKAYQKNENIIVEWSVENEAGIKNYEIEKSASGLSFTSAVIVTPHNTPVSSYTWLDTKPVTGNNYYRIKSTDLNGKIQYSKIAQVTVAERKPAITIYPNPAKNGVIHLQLVNQPEGVYVLRLINKPGQVLVSRKVNHSYNAGIERIDINANASHGIYNLEIIKPDNSKVIEKIVY